MHKILDVKSWVCYNDVKGGKNDDKIQIRCAGRIKEKRVYFLYNKKKQVFKRGDTCKDKARRTNKHEKSQCYLLYA